MLVEPAQEGPTTVPVCPPHFLRGTNTTLYVRDTVSSQCASPTARPQCCMRGVLPVLLVHALSSLCLPSEICSRIF